jgi:hypothetical protein
MRQNWETEDYRQLVHAVTQAAMANPGRTLQELLETVNQRFSYVYQQPQSTNFLQASPRAGSVSVQSSPGAGSQTGYLIDNLSPAGPPSGDRRMSYPITPSTPYPQGRQTRFASAGEMDIHSSSHLGPAAPILSGRPHQIHSAPQASVSRHPTPTPTMQLHHSAELASHFTGTLFWSSVLTFQGNESGFQRSRDQHPLSFPTTGPVGQTTWTQDTFIPYNAATQHPSVQFPEVMQRGPQQLHQQTPPDNFRPVQTSSHRPQEFPQTQTNENPGTASESDHEHHRANYEPRSDVREQGIRRLLRWDWHKGHLESQGGC